MELESKVISSENIDVLIEVLIDVLIDVLNDFC
jgi:hypothetical protein